MKIETIKVSDLKPYPTNPRKNDSAVDTVVMSIKEFGFKNPIIIDKNNEIIAGHTRLRAAKLLKMDEVPIIRVEDLTPQQVKAYRIMDNRSQELSEWDSELLQMEMDNLRDKDFDVDLTGFDFGDLSSLDKVNNGEDIDWVGNPEFNVKEKGYKIIVLFEEEQEREEFVEKFEFMNINKNSRNWSIENE